VWNTTQYRMHELLTRLPNLIYYAQSDGATDAERKEDLMVTPEGQSERLAVPDEVRKCQIGRWERRDAFHSVWGMAHVSDDTAFHEGDGSWSNVEGARAAVKAMDEYHAAGVSSKAQVLTVYTAQLRLVKRLLRNAGYEFIRGPVTDDRQFNPAAKLTPEPKTVDGFQGGQAEYIILCWARSRRFGEEPAFAMDLRRLLVGCTRARRQFLGIGDFTHFRDHDIPRQFVDKFSVRPATVSRTGFVWPA